MNPSKELVALLEQLGDVPDSPEVLAGSLVGFALAQSERAMSHAEFLLMCSTLVVGVEA